MAEEEYGSFLDLNLGEVPDLRAVPGDREYQLQVIGAKIGTSSGEKTRGQQYVLIRFKILNEESTKSVTYPIMLPSREEDKETNDNRKRRMKSFVQAIGWDPSGGFNIDELEGETCWAILTVEEDAQYGERNNIQRFVNPQES